MPFHSASDFAFMFDDTIGLGTEAIYSETDAAVNIILRSNSLGEDGYEVDLKTAIVGAEVQTSDVPDIATSQHFTVGAVIYEVVRIGPDEEGVIKLGFRIIENVRALDTGEIRVTSSGGIRVRVP